MKKFFCFLLLVVVLLSGCVRNENKIIKSLDNYPNLKSINITDFDEHLKLPHDSLMIYSLIVDKSYVKDKIGLDYINKTDKGEYSIHRVKFENGKEGYCFISYENNMVIDCYFVAKIPKKIDFFFKIFKGKSTFDDIKMIDPAAILIDGETPTSYHRFKDGTMMEIEYKNTEGKIVVKNRRLMKDPVKIIKKLSDDDLMLIS